MKTSNQKRILAELRENSRQPLSRIAKKLNIPLSTAHDSYKSIKHCIKQRTTLISFEKLGYSLKVNFIFRIRNNDIIKLILENMHVNSVYKVNNRHTVVAECIFKNICQAYEFKEALNDLGIKKVEMRYIIEEIKKESFRFSHKNPY